MRTCKACGCYIPDLWSECQACGRLLQSGGNLESVGTATFEIVDVRYGNGNEDVMHVPVPIELEPYWPWSEIKLHQGTNK